jgi:hypothetical protein
LFIVATYESKLHIAMIASVACRGPSSNVTNNDTIRP